jgi:hypothetical protein
LVLARTSDGGEAESPRNPLLGRRIGNHDFGSCRIRSVL